MVKYTRLLLVATIVLLFNNWALAPLLNPRMGTNVSLISEISALSQPYHWVFQLGDSVAGIIILGCIPWLWATVRRKGLSQSMLLVALVAIMGADSITDALLPISCAPSVDTQCQLAQSHSLITYAHMIESTAAGVLIVVAPLLWWLASKRKQRNIARLSLGFVVLQLVVGSTVVAAQIKGWGIIGAAQRVYECGIGLWLGGLVLWSQQLPRQAVIEQTRKDATLDLDLTQAS
jgi:hypothetical protein